MGKKLIAYLVEQKPDLFWTFFPKLKSSKVFCMAPWIQLHAQTNGHVAPCCMASMHSGNELADLNTNANLSTAWNNEAMQNLRKNMLEGKENRLCINCYKYESLGKKSERQKYNEDYVREAGRVLQTSREGKIAAHFKPLYLDLRFSNKCNFKCRICDSSYSALWYEEEQKLGKKPQLPSEKNMYLSDKKGEFRKSLLPLLNEVERIHFAGGEPLIMDEHYDILLYLLGQGLNHVVLSYNTNFSTLKYKGHNVLDLWSQFPQVEVWASLDGVGEQGDYMRKGQRWNVIEQNILTLKIECPHVLFGVNATISCFNILHLTELLDYLIEKDLAAPQRIYLYLLFGPAYFSITQLPDTIKEKAEKNIRAWMAPRLKTNAYHTLLEHLETILTYMNSEESTILDQTKEWIIKVDKLRNENFASVFPELADMLKDTKST
jgi:MoaA/NifB/PqqE/SkfB family radical SAM enzyme